MGDVRRPCGVRGLARVGGAAALAAVLSLTGCEFGVETASEPSPEPSGSAEAVDPGAGEQGHAREAGGEPHGALLLIMDASSSMNATDASGQTLLDGAKQALRDVVDTLPDGQQVGLRVYGHRVPDTDRENGCQDTELIQPVAPLDRGAMLAAIDGYDAVGYTPIGLSLRQAAYDLPQSGPRTIVLVSDGEDTCAPPDPCDVAQELASNGVGLVVHTVGFALEGNAQARQELECIAEASGGEYHDAGTAADLGKTLTEVTEQARPQPLEGTTVRQDAPTGEVETLHTDTVRTGERKFYRFQIVPGSTVQAEVLVHGNPEPVPHDSRCARVSFAGPSYGAYGSESDFGSPDQQLAVSTQEFRVGGDQIWLSVMLAFGGCVYDEPQVPYDIDFRVRVVG